MITCSHAWTPLTMHERHHRRLCKECRTIEIYVSGGPRRARTWYWREATSEERVRPSGAPSHLWHKWAMEKPSLARAMGIRT